MIIAKKSFALFACVLAAILAGGCANPFSQQDTSAARPALPPGWYKLPEQGGPQNPGERSVRPDEKMSESVGTAFRVHTDALAALDHELEAPALDSQFNLVWQLPQYTPWHLDGMIANFGISGSGLFGPLMLEGAVAVKATWKSSKNKAADKAAFRVASAKKASLKFRSSMSDRDVAKMLEPIVRSAVDTKIVRDEKTFRRNLNRHGRSFLNQARVINRVPHRRGWHLHGYELKLIFNAEGQISATVGVGGTFIVFFAWEEEEKTEKLDGAVALVGVEDALYRNMVGFVRTIGSLIPDALNDAIEIRRSGFELHEFEVGVGITAGGDIGVARIEGAIEGKMIFEPNGAEHFSSELLTEDGRGDDYVNMLEFGEPTPAQLTYASQFGTSAARLSGTETVFRIPRERFREGMKQAIEMGTYFATEGRRQDTSSWKLAKVETEFAGSIGGDIGVVTVQGAAIYSLVFERIGL